MTHKTGWIVFGLALCGLGLLSGCATTAAGIVDHYGVIDDEDVVAVIESGQADAMIEKGHAKVRYSTKGTGDDRVLVKKYYIHGEVYRVEVYPAIDPIDDIATHRVRSAKAERGDWEDTFIAVELMSILNCIHSDSYSARGEVATRAWIDSDGKLHQARVNRTPEPNWQTGPNDLQLYVLTRDGPITTFWLRGIVPPDQQEADTDKWILISAGPGEVTERQGQLQFINRKLADRID